MHTDTEPTQAVLTRERATRDLEKRTVLEYLSEYSRSLPSDRNQAHLTMLGEYTFTSRAGAVRGESALGRHVGYVCAVVKDGCRAAGRHRQQGWVDWCELIEAHRTSSVKQHLLKNGKLRQDVMLDLDFLVVSPASWQRLCGLCYREFHDRQ